MADLSFTEDDGVLHLQIGPSLARLQGRGNFSFTAPLHGPPSRLAHPGRRSRLQLVQRLATIVSALLFVAVVGLLIWRWLAGDEIPAFVSISADVASVALLGSLVSLGGVSFLSVQGAIATSVEGIDSLQQRCPFESISRDTLHEGREPGNPDFCVKCPLGIDTINDHKQGSLIHGCAVYDALHQRWRHTAAGRHYARRHGIDEDD